MKKILVVDDEAGIRSLLKEFLEMENYLVYTAKSGMEAMQGLKYSGCEHAGYGRLYGM